MTAEDEQDPPFLRALTAPGAVSLPVPPSVLADPPQIRSDGGPVISAPRLVPVVWASDSDAPKLTDFIAKLASSSYLRETTVEYGVGQATSTPAVILSTPPPVTISAPDIPGWLTSQLVATGSPFPAPDNNTIYELFFPLGTTILLPGLNPDGSPGVSCLNFGAYHQALPPLPSGATPSFAVMPRCSTPYLGNVGLDQATGAASHETIEAATDPYGTAYADENFAASGWSFAIVSGPFAEVGDLCEIQPHAFYTPSDVGYLVQRTWSNQAAAAGHDPCVPAPRGPYFNALPIVGGTEPFGGTPATSLNYLKGISLKPGQSKTIELRLFSDAATTPWTLSAEEGGNPHANHDPANLLRFSFDDTTGRSGDVRRLTVTLAEPPDGGSYDAATAFAVKSTIGTRTNAWWVAVGE